MRVAVHGNAVRILATTRFPSGLFHRHGACHAVDYVLRDEAPTPGARERTIQVAPQLRNAVPQRIAAFVAGRFCAGAALEALGHAGATDVAMHDDRAPAWPPAVVGSITHTASRAMAVVAPGDELHGIGIDCERILPAAEALELAARIAPELDEIRRSAEMARGQGEGMDAGFGTGELVSIVFSVKESLYKCLAPLVREFFDFDDVHAEALRVAGGGNGRTGTVALVLKRPLGGGRLLAGTRFEGWFSLDETHVSSVVEFPAAAHTAEDLHQAHGDRTTRPNR